MRSRTMRRVARNAIAPQSALPAPIAAQHARTGAPGGIGINQRARQPAIELGIRLGGVELAQRHLAVRPRQFEGAVSHAGVLIFFHQRQRALRGFRSRPMTRSTTRGFIRRQS